PGSGTRCQRQTDPPGGPRPPWSVRAHQGTGLGPADSAQGHHSRSQEGQRPAVALHRRPQRGGRRPRIAALLAEGTPEAAAGHLIAAALEHGGSDNVTVIVVDLLTANAERIVPGVKSWLDDLGVAYEFWSRIEMDEG